MERPSHARPSCRKSTALTPVTFLTELKSAPSIFFAVLLLLLKIIQQPRGAVAYYVLYI